MERVAQAVAIVRFAPDSDVGEHTEHRAAPVSAAPGRRVIEALIAGTRQSVRGEPLD